MRLLNIIASILVAIGGLNWLSVGIFNYNFVSLLDAISPVIARIIYIIVGVATLYLIYSAIVSNGKIDYRLDGRDNY